MSGKQDAVKCLQSVSATCDAALAALKDLDSTTSAPEGQNARAVTLKTLLSDFSSLLTLLYQSTTKLAIALKPSSPTYAAALTPLKELRTNIDALASCSCSIEAERFGKALTREARWATEDVVNALQQLFAVFLNEAGRSGTDTKAYLAKTGAVHEAIERARGVSHSNREAVRKRWTSDIDGLEDCVNEVLESTNDGDGVREDEEDDGWDDLDIGGSLKGDAPKPTVDEMERLNSAHKFFKSIHVLLETISSRLLSKPVKVEVKPPTQLDSLLVTSNALLAASDELVSALDVPHDSQAIHEAYVAVAKNVSDLRAFLAAHGVASAPAREKSDDDILTNKITSLSLDGSPVRDHPLDEANLPFDAYFVDVLRWGDALTIGS